MKKILSLGSIAVVLLLVSVSFSPVVSSNVAKESLDELFEVKTSYYTLKGVEEVISYLNEEELEELKNSLSEMSSALEDDNNDKIDKQSAFLKEIGIVKDGYEFITHEFVNKLNSKINLRKINEDGSKEGRIENYFCFNHFNGKGSVKYFLRTLTEILYTGFFALVVGIGFLLLLTPLVQNILSFISSFAEYKLIYLVMIIPIICLILPISGMVAIFDLFQYIISEIVGRITPLKILNPYLELGIESGNYYTLGLNGSKASNTLSDVRLIGFTGLCIQYRESKENNLFLSGFTIKTKTYD